MASEISNRQGYIERYRSHGSSPGYHIKTCLNGESELGYVIGARTDKGIVRPNNEDAFFIDEEYGLFVVADGMGGREAGEVASRMATEIIPEVIKEKTSEGLEPTAILREAIEIANERIYESSLRNAEWKGMGTTVVVALLTAETVWIAHAGDSRAYLIEGGEIIKTTEDHSKVTEMVREGLIAPAEARTHVMHNIITRVLGVRREIDPEIAVWTWPDDAVLLLCSDGLTEMLKDAEMCDIMISSGRPDEICDRLIETANDKGGRDNITAVLVMKTGTFSAHRTPGGTE